MEKQKKTTIVGQVVEVSQHPNADRLYIAKVNIGRDELVSVIFGGDRMLKGEELVPIALPGTHLPNGEKIRVRKWRGIQSYAELLSSDELGWTVGGPDEVVVLSSANYRVGDPVH